MVQALKKKLKSEKGFTLIELLAVIVILGILAAIAIPSVMNIINNQKLAAVKADSMTILNGAKLYYADHGKGTATNASNAEVDLAATDLGTYVDGVTTFSTYTVHFVGSTPYLTGTGTKDSQTITFTKATISDINSAAKNATAIGSANAY